MEYILRISGLSKEFYSRGKKVTALHNIDLDIKEGEFITIVGPSGCGKSTILNIVVGLVSPTRGDIWYRGNKIGSINTEIGYVTQNDNLYPWRTLIKNVELALEIQGLDSAIRKKRAMELIEQVGLSGFEDHYPHELSGGMRQRVNIIRTLIYNPDVILMDEPFGPLDAQTRLILQDQLLKLWSDAKKTVIFVTHDMVEAIALADRVVVMTARPGKVKSINPVNISRPRDVFHIHGTEGFKSLYDKLWEDLQIEFKKIEN